MSDYSNKQIKVVLTGTTGSLGSTILKDLLTNVPKSSIIISLYNPSKRPEDADGIEIREGNYNDPQTLDRAFSGADVLLLMSCPGFQFQERVIAHTNAIEAAKRTSIRHILYTSLALAGGPSSSESVSAVMQAHLATEEYLKNNLPPSMTYTILRMGIYTEYFPIYFGLYDFMTRPSEVHIPHGDNGELIAFTRRGELAEAVAKIIQRFIDGKGEEQEFVNKTVWLSAEPKYTLPALGALLGRIMGTQPVEVKHISMEEFTAPGGRAASFVGGSTELAKASATAYTAIGRKETAYTGEGSRDLERILGRKPEDVEDTLKRMLGIN